MICFICSFFTSQRIYARSVDVATLFANATVFACLTIAAGSACCQTYNGYTDQGNFDGNVATIEYKEATVVDHISVWVGIDDGGPVQWYQSGWFQDVGQTPRVYFEYIDATTSRHKTSGGSPPASGGDYSVARNGSNVDYVAGNILAGSVLWVDARYCYAQYKVELHNEVDGDRTPGTSVDPLSFSDIQVRSRGEDWTNADLAMESKSTHGVLSMSGNSFTVYDDRSQE